MPTHILRFSITEPCLFRTLPRVGVTSSCLLSKAFHIGDCLFQEALSSFLIETKGDLFSARKSVFYGMTVSRKASDLALKTDERYFSSPGLAKSKIVSELQPPFRLQGS